MALNQRSGIAPGGTPRPDPLERCRMRHVDGVDLDRDAMILRVDGRRTPITPQEFALLDVLMENAGRVLTRQELLDRTWGPGRGRDSNTLVVLTSRLRRKLRRADGSSRIRTVRAIGYVLDESAD